MRMEIDNKLIGKAETLLLVRRSGDATPSGGEWLKKVILNLMQV
jgi:hypothetical protein